MLASVTFVKLSFVSVDVYVGGDLKQIRERAVYCNFGTDITRRCHYTLCRFLLPSGEWISGSTCMYIAHRIATQYGKDDKVCTQRVTISVYRSPRLLLPYLSFPSWLSMQVTELLGAAEVMIMPVVNPDGYVVRRMTFVMSIRKHLVCSLCSWIN